MQSLLSEITSIVLEFAGCKNDFSQINVTKNYLSADFLTFIFPFFLLTASSSNIENMAGCQENKWQTCRI